MRTLQSEMKRLKLNKKGDSAQKKPRGKNINEIIKGKRKNQEESIDFAEMMGMNKKLLKRGKGGAWR